MAVKPGAECEGLEVLERIGQLHSPVFVRHHTFLRPDHLDSLNTTRTQDQPPEHQQHYQSIVTLIILFFVSIIFLYFYGNCQDIYSVLFFSFLYFYTYWLSGYFTSCEPIIILHTFINFSFLLSWFAYPIDKVVLFTGKQLKSCS